MPLDPTYPYGRVTFILSDAQPVVVLTLSTSPTLCRRAGLPVLYLDSMTSEAEAPTGFPLRDAGPIDRLAYVMYTSGPTGEPKGVMAAV